MQQLGFLSPNQRLHICSELSPSSLPEHPRSSKRFMHVGSGMWSSAWSISRVCILNSGHRAAFPGIPSYPHQSGWRGSWMSALVFGLASLVCLRKWRFMQSLEEPENSRLKAPVLHHESSGHTATCVSPPPASHPHHVQTKGKTPTLKCDA